MTGVERKERIVFLAMPVNRDFPIQTVHALLRSHVMALNAGIEIRFHTYDGCSLVHKARNALTKEFLDSNATHLFWIDSDLEWQPETFVKFIVLSEKMDMLCGAYPKKQDKPQFYMTPLQNSVMTNEYGCIEIKRMAAGFSIIRREVMEKLAATKPLIRMDGPESTPVPYVFRLDDLDGELRGEDMAYCDDIRSLGFKIWLDPNVVIGHVGQKCFNHKIVDQMTRVDVPDIQRPGPVAA